VVRALASVKLLRPRHWIKNGFVFAPLLFTGRYTDKSSLLETTYAFTAFCLAASCVYILNDLRDIESDRLHPKKSLSRPLASGAIKPATAATVLAFLFICLIAALIHSPSLLPSIAGYIALNIAYSLYLKHQPVLDIFTIATGFVLRIFAGASALAVPLSSWMFVTGFSLALYLAAMKRLSELKETGTESRRVLEMYSEQLMDKFTLIAAISSLTFYSLFTLTSRPELIGTIPLVLFGVMRYWYVADHLKGGESPTDALSKDWQLLLTGAIWLGIVVWGIQPAA
jgi:4-hydroxybenzoate polyprenyltransferase